MKLGRRKTKTLGTHINKLNTKSLATKPRKNFILNYVQKHTF